MWSPVTNVLVLTCSVESKAWSDTGTSATGETQRRWSLELWERYKGRKRKWHRVTQASLGSMWIRSVCEWGWGQRVCVCVCVPAVHMVNTTWTESKKKNMTSRDTEAPMGRNSACVESMVWIPAKTRVREDAELVFIIQQMIWVVLINATVYIPSFNRHVCKPSARCLCPGY